MTFSTEIQHNFLQDYSNLMKLIFEDSPIPKQSLYSAPEPAIEQHLPYNNDSCQIPPAIIENAFFQHKNLSEQPSHSYVIGFQLIKLPCIPPTSSTPPHLSNSITSQLSAIPESNTRKRKILKKAVDISSSDAISSTFKKRNTWTESEHNRLLDLRRKKIQYKTIATALGKTERACYLYFSRLPKNIKKEINGSLKKWGPNQLKYFLDYVATSSGTWKEKAAMMNKEFNQLGLDYSVNTCRVQYQRIKKKQEEVARFHPPA